MRTNCTNTLVNITITEKWYKSRLQLCGNSWPSQHIKRRNHFSSIHCKIRQYPLPPNNHYCISKLQFVHFNILYLCLSCWHSQSAQQSVGLPWSAVLFNHTWAPKEQQRHVTKTLIGQLFTWNILRWSNFRTNCTVTKNIYIQGYISFIIYSTYLLLYVLDIL